MGLVAMLEELKESAADSERLKAEIAKIRPKVQAKIRDETLELQKEKQNRQLCEIELTRVKSEISNLNADLSQQKQISAASLDDADRQLSRSLRLLQTELETERRNARY